MKIRYIGEGRYSGDDDGKEILVNHGQIINVSENKFLYLLRVFPNNWEDPDKAPELVEVKKIETIIVQSEEVKENVESKSAQSAESESKVTDIQESGEEQK